MRSVINTEELNNELEESLQFAVDLLHAQMSRLALKNKPFQTFRPATTEMIDTLWNQINEIDESIQVFNNKNVLTTM